MNQIPNSRAELQTVDSIWSREGAVIGHGETSLAVVSIKLPVLPCLVIGCLSEDGHSFRLRTVELKHNVENLGNSFKYQDNVLLTWDRGRQADKHVEWGLTEGARNTQITKVHRRQNKTFCGRRLLEKMTFP